MTEIVAKVIRRALAPRAIGRFETQGLPTFIVPALRSFISGSYDRETAETIDRVERERQRLIDMGDVPVGILYSPKPGSAGDVATEDMRPEHGREITLTMARAARTGKDRRWGAALHQIARAARSTNFLELGSCVGMSAAYLASAPTRKMFRTIEGSPDLARVAADVLARAAPGAVVLTGLFDDVLDSILPGIEPIDFLFIDGHHEKVATIHYWQRCLPHLADGAIVIFDDISWSQDMRDGWDHLARQSSFSQAMDLGAIGVCVHSARPTKPVHWDLSPVIGKHKIGVPWGWSEEAG